MIRVFVCIKKLAHMSDEQFHAHWRHPHGTLTRRMKQLRGYVQSHGIGAVPTVPGLSPTPYLGVPMIWLDGLADLAAMTADPEFIPLREDALLLYDQQDVVWLVTREIEGGDAADREWDRMDCVNALLLLRRAPGRTAAEFERGLREFQHALRSTLAGRAQSRASLPETDFHGAAVPAAYDALVEVRFADEAACARLWRHEAVQAAVQRMFATVADHDSSRGFLGREERFI